MAAPLWGATLEKGAVPRGVRPKMGGAVPAAPGSASERRRWPPRTVTTSALREAEGDLARTARRARRTPLRGDFCALYRVGSAAGIPKRLLMLTSCLT